MGGPKFGVHYTFLSVPFVSGAELTDVINVHHRLRRERAPAEVALVSFIGEQTGSAAARTRLARQNLRLSQEARDIKRQPETRKIVERAKGILQRDYSMREEAAYLRLWNESRRMRRPMRELA